MRISEDIKHAVRTNPFDNESEFSDLLVILIRNCVALCPSVHSFCPVLLSSNYITVKTAIY